MRVPVLTALAAAPWEADLVAALGRADAGVVVVRRCVDLADLLATAATGQARAALVSADLRRLDREALGRLAAAGVAVVGLVGAGEEEPERRLRQLGVDVVLPADAEPARVSEAVHTLVAGRSEQAARPPTTAAGEPGAAAAASTPYKPGDEEAAAQPVDGRVVAVWGPTGAPGRTTVAVGLAGELAAARRDVLLVDADVYGGVVAQVLGLLDEAPGLAAACRAANSGTLDVPRLAQLARAVPPSLRVLSGIPRADRWPELRPAALEVVLDLARRTAPVTVVDCGFALEQDEELAYDTLAPRRNGATLTVLEQADVVLAVGSADPVGLQRLVRGLAELKEAVPGVTPQVVVNRLRSSAVPGDAAAEVRRALQRFAGVPEVHLVPHDVPALDRALVAGRTLAEAVPDSPARRALHDLAVAVAGVPAAPARRRAARRRRR